MFQICSYDLIFSIQIILIAAFVQVMSMIMLFIVCYRLHYLMNLRLDYFKFTLIFGLLCFIGGLIGILGRFKYNYNYSFFY